MRRISPAWSKACKSSPPRTWKPRMVSLAATFSMASWRSISSSPCGPFSMGRATKRPSTACFCAAPARILATASAAQAAPTPPAKSSATSARLTISDVPKTNILPNAIRLPRLAPDQPRQIPRTARGLLQKGFRQAQHHLARIRTSCPVLWLDRWRSKKHRRDQLYDSLHSAQAHQHLECHQYQICSRAHKERPDASRRLQSLCRSQRKKVCHLLI